MLLLGRSSSGLDQLDECLGARKRILQLEECLALWRVERQVLRKGVDDLFVWNAGWDCRTRPGDEGLQPSSLDTKGGCLVRAQRLGQHVNVCQPIRPALILARYANLHDPLKHDVETAIRQLFDVRNHPPTANP